MKSGTLYRNRWMIHVDFLVTGLTLDEVYGYWINRVSGAIIAGPDHFPAARVTSEDWKVIND